MQDRDKHKLIVSSISLKSQSDRITRVATSDTEEHVFFQWETLSSTLGENDGVQNQQRWHINKNLNERYE